MDESNHPLLHQWLSACRQLMLHHPRHGARTAGVQLGYREPDLQPGWNVISTRENSIHKELYTFIGEDEGVTTPIHPDVPSNTIHKVPTRLPDLSSTSLWKITKDLAQRLSEINKEPYSSKRIAGVMESIQKAARSDGTKIDIEAMKEWVHRSWATMRRALNECRYDKIPTGDFLKPALEVLRAYLSFELPGEIAREILAGILSTQRTLPCLGPPSMMPPRARLKAIEHLVDLVYQIDRQREKVKVTPYFELTYLAGLYCGAAISLAAHAGEVGGLSDGETIKVENLGFWVEEWFCHKVSLTFLLPANYTPGQTVRLLDANATHTGKPLKDVVDSYGLYPGLRSLLCPTSKFRPMSSSDVLRFYRNCADSSQSFDVLAAIENVYHPVASSNQEAIVRDLLTMTIGHRI